MDEIANPGLRKTGVSRASRESHIQEKGRQNRSGEPYTDPHEEPLLNLDILRLICHFLNDIPDVLSFALTCSDLTEDALRRRLKMAPVDLWKGELVDSLHDFIFSNEQSRAPYIYGLKIRVSSYHDSRYISKSDFQMISDRLVSIVKAATHIQYVDFITSDAVVDAVVKLTTVRELHIFTDSYTSQRPLLAGLAAFQSPLRSLSIMGRDAVGSTISAAFLHDRLSHLSPTLEFLELDEFPINVVPSSVTTQFTAVRSLTLYTALPNWHECDLLGVLVRLFPNLDDTLQLGSLYSYIRPHEVPTFRERCEEAQKRQSWSRLDRLVCDAYTAYLLTLLCPVSRMDISVESPGPIRCEYLVETLRHNCPPQLYIRIIMLLDGFGALDGMFPPEATEKLTHLVLFANIEIRHGRRSSRRHRSDNVHTTRFLNRLLGSIKHLRLTHLRVVLRYTVYLPPRKYIPNVDVVDISDGVDLQVNRAGFIDTVPSLAYLFLTTCGMTYAVPSRKRLPKHTPENRAQNVWLSSKAWRVARAGEDRPLDSDAGLGSCVELSRTEAERIVDREQLQLSRRDEKQVEWCGRFTRK